METKRNYRHELGVIRQRFLLGDLNYVRARALVEPILDEMNEKAKVVAKAHGKRFTPLTFTSVMR